MIGISPRHVLLTDAIACFLGGVLLVAIPPVWEWADLPSDWRLPTAAALLIFSGVLSLASRIQSRLLVAMAVLGNIAWILAGAFALTHTGSTLGAGLIVLVMVADAMMAWLQAANLAKPQSM